MPSPCLFSVAFFCVVALATSGCAADGAVVESPLRVGTVDDLSSEAIGLVAGVTTLDEARARLRARGLTGLVEDALASDSGTTAALAADYQSRVLVFRDGRFAEAIALPTHGLPPYDVAVHLAADRGSRALLVLYRDPLDRAEEPPTLLLFAARDRPVDARASFEIAGRMTLEKLVARHDGLAQPLFVGNDLGDGVMVVARDRQGALWDTSYLIRAEAARITLEPRPMSDALRCSCVQRYADGTVKR